MRSAIGEMDMKMRHAFALEELDKKKGVARA